MADSPFTVKRKTRLTPVVIRVEVGEVDENDQDITRTLEFECIPFLSGEEMLRLAAVVDSDVSAGQQQFFARVLKDDAERKRWAEFLRSSNAPDANELVEITYWTIGKFGNRDAENPTG